MPQYVECHTSRFTSNRRITAGCHAPRYNALNNMDAIMCITNFICQCELLLLLVLLPLLMILLLLLQLLLFLLWLTPLITTPNSHD